MHNLHTLLLLTSVAKLTLSFYRNFNAIQLIIFIKGQIDIFGYPFVLITDYSTEAILQSVAQAVISVLLLCIQKQFQCSLSVTIQRDYFLRGVISRQIQAYTAFIQHRFDIVAEAETVGQWHIIQLNLAGVSLKAH